MSAPVTAETLARAVQRAAEYRRAQVPATDGRHRGEAIQGQPSSVSRALDSADADGWLLAGEVFDEIAAWWGGGLAVYWHPETDRVRVQRPIDPDYPPPPTVRLTSPYFDGGGVYRSRPGFWHERGGVVACGPCAALAASRAGTAEGWNSRSLFHGEIAVCGTCGAYVGETTVTRMTLFEEHPEE